MNFSRDKAQSCLYVGDNTNQTIYILNRGTLQELGRFGRAGRMAGDFHWLHQVSVDSRGTFIPPKSTPASASRNSCAMAPTAAVARVRKTWADPEPGRRSSGYAAGGAPRARPDRSRLTRRD